MLHLCYSHLKVNINLYGLLRDLNGFFIGDSYPKVMVRDKDIDIMNTINIVFFLSF